MALKLDSFIPAPSDVADDRDGIGPHADRDQRLVTAVAASLALLIVAAVAVLMGMA